MRPLSNIRLLVLLAAGIFISVQPSSAQRRGSSEQSSRREYASSRTEYKRTEPNRNSGNNHRYNNDRSNQRNDQYANAYNRQQAKSWGHAYAPNSGNRNDVYRNGYIQRHNHTCTYYAPPVPRDESHLCYNVRYYQRGYVWVPGYWNWNPHIDGYAWVNGYWEQERVGYVYYPGYWENVRGGGYIWITGGWFRV